jgi:hypothetical protein
LSLSKLIGSVPRGRKLMLAATGKIEAAAADRFRRLRRQWLPGPEPAVGHLAGEQILRRRDARATMP